MGFGKKIKVLKFWYRRTLGAYEIIKFYRIVNFMPISDSLNNVCKSNSVILMIFIISQAPKIFLYQKFHWSILTICCFRSFHLMVSRLQSKSQLEAIAGKTCLAAFFAANKLLQTIEAHAEGLIGRIFSTIKLFIRPRESLFL